jgi:hypothetical protein
MKLSSSLAVVLALPLLACGVAPTARTATNASDPKPASTTSQPAVAPSGGPCTTLPRTQVTTRDDGTIVYVEADPSRKVQSAVDEVPAENLCIVRPGAAPALLVAGRASDDPSKSLVAFSDLVFDRAEEALFFSTSGWVTSPAAHRVDLRTGEVRFLADGVVIGRVTDGPHAGGILMRHYRLDDERSVDDPAYEGRREVFSVVDAHGRELARLGTQPPSATWTSPRGKR